MPASIGGTCVTRKEIFSLTPTHRFHRKNLLKTTDNSLISDLQLILIVDVLREKMFFFSLNMTAIASWPTSPDPHTTHDVALVTLYQLRT
jgi:hypothetical protein